MLIFILKKKSNEKTTLQYFEISFYLLCCQSSSMALGRESISVSTESLTSSALSLNSGASPRKLASPAPEGNTSDSSSGARRKTQKATKLKKKGTYYITDYLICVLAICLIKILRISLKLEVLSLELHSLE